MNPIGGEVTDAEIRRALIAHCAFHDGDVFKKMRAAILASRAATSTTKPADSVVVQGEPSAYGPENLWLQLHGDCCEDDLLKPVDYTNNEVTWCWHAINDSDVRYVRADLAQPVAPGWQLVPVEPAREMLEAGVQAAYRHDRQKARAYAEQDRFEGAFNMGLEEYQFGVAYAAALSAAPSMPPKAE